jgi:hypothetical protein
MGIGFLTSDEEESHIIGTGHISQLNDAPPERSALGTNASAIALKAASLVGGSKQEEYGPKSESLGRVAGLWNAYLAARRDPAAPLTAVDVAHMNVLEKIARTQGPTIKEDHWVDLVGYGCIAVELALNPD